MLAEGPMGLAAVRMGPQTALLVTLHSGQASAGDNGPGPLRYPSERCAMGTETTWLPEHKTASWAVLRRSRCTAHMCRGGRGLVGGCRGRIGMAARQGLSEGKK